MKQRVFWMDVVRSTALFGIIGCHVYAFLSTASAGTWEAGQHVSYLEQALFLYFARFGVPFFLMLTGALLLGRDYSSGNDILRFYLHSFVPLFIATEVWIVVLHFCYYGLETEMALLSKDSIKILLKDLVLWRGSAYGHMWYMKEILVVYLFLPFFSLALRGLSPKVLVFPLGYVYYCSLGLTTGNLLFRLVTQESFFYCPDVFTFLSYLAVGYGVAEKKLLRRVPGWLLWLAMAAMAALQMGVILLERSYVDIWSEMLSYASLFIFVGSVAAFELFARWGQRERAASPLAAGLFCFISERSFGSYLIHFTVLMIALRRLGPLLGQIPNEVLRFAAADAVIMAVSLAVTQILGLVPLFRRYLVHMK